MREHFFKEFFTNDEFIKRLSSEIAAQLFHLQKKEKEVNFPESDVFWKEYDDYFDLYSLFTLPHKPKIRKDIAKKDYIIGGK